MSDATRDNKPLKETTKICHACGSHVLISYTSLNMKQCADCYTTMPWFLEPGQKPLMGPSRLIRSSSDESEGDA